MTVRLRVTPGRAHRTLRSFSPNATQSIARSPLSRQFCNGPVFLPLLALFSSHPPAGALFNLPSSTIISGRTGSLNESTVNSDILPPLTHGTGLRAARPHLHSQTPFESGLMIPRRNELNLPSPQPSFESYIPAEIAKHPSRLSSNAASPNGRLGRLLLSL